MQMLALLHSINDRLGGQTGQDVEPLELDWLDDMMRYQQARADAMKPDKTRSQFGGNDWDE